MQAGEEWFELSHMQIRCSGGDDGEVTGTESGVESKASGVHGVGPETVHGSNKSSR